MIGFASALLIASATCTGVAAVYYGSDIGDLQRLAAHPPEIVVPGDVPFLQAAVPILHPAGIRVLAYIPTCWADTQCMAGNDYGLLSTVEGQVDQAMQFGADGIFFDEATPDAVAGTADGIYYGALFQYVKSKYGSNTIVAINPGEGDIDESTLSVADIVCLECSWDATQFNPSWKSQYDPRRFWGLDGDCRPVMTAQAAAGDTGGARSNGVGFFYATDLYVNLPGWYESYIQAAGICVSDAVADGGIDGGSLRPDAGTDGGEAVLDAGVRPSDGGMDGGGTQPDAGAIDAGAVDAGSAADSGAGYGQPGCRCNGAAGGWEALMCVLAGLGSWRRRRQVRRARMSWRSCCGRHGVEAEPS